MILTPIILFTTNYLYKNKVENRNSVTNNLQFTLKSITLDKRTLQKQFENSLALKTKAIKQKNSTNKTQFSDFISKNNKKHIVFVQFK